MPSKREDDSSERNEKDEKKNKPSPATTVGLGSVVTLQTGSRVTVLKVLPISPDMPTGGLQVVSDELVIAALPKECFR